LSTAVEDIDEAAGPGLALDGTHTLVSVEPEDLEALWRPDAMGSLGWLLFRSGSTARSSGAGGHGAPPELWFEVGGRRIAAALRDSAGWRDPSSAAVALFEVRAEPASGGSGAGPARATCGIRVADRDTMVELPARWLARLSVAFGDLG